MTTVAANLTMIAADSNVSDGSEDFRVLTKIFAVKGGYAGYCGHVHVGLKIIEWLQNQRKKKPEFTETDTASVLILDAEGLAYVDTTLRIMRLRESQYAIGTGGMAARAAMLCGRDPQSAVEIACKIDPNSKTPIDMAKLKTRISVA